MEDQSIEPNFSNDNITNLLQNLKAQKACGPDNLPNIMLNNCSESLANSLSVIFRTFYNKRCFPTFWKKSEITPLFKNTDQSLVKKYRPISLLSNISKVWKKMIEKTIAEIFLPQVDPCQYGFVPKRPTLLQLLSYTDEFYRTRDSLTKFRSLVYIDFAQVFDKLDHKRILEALHSTGIPNKAVEIVKSYLDTRMQRVKNGTMKSPELPLTSGVPHGSISGPLFFLVFVNSLPKVVTTSSIYMFTDDTEIMSSNPMELQKVLDRFVQWCDQNKMEINVEKTLLMMFRGDDSQKIRMKNVNIQTSPFERHLGVVISEDLSWVEQTKTRCNKAYRAFFNLKRNTSPLSSLCSRLNMYCGFVVPFLTHCSPVWHANSTSMKELERVQKRVTKWICRTSQVDYKTRLIQLKLLPIKIYIEMHDLLTFCKKVADQYNFDWKKHINPIEKNSLETTTTSPFYLPKIRRSKTKNFGTELFNFTEDYRELWIYKNCAMWKKVSKIITGSSSSTTFVKKTCAHGESTVNVEPARHEGTGICVGSIPFRWRN